jgi:hypothetical protein
MNKELEKLISYLMHSRTQVHVFHLQTDSYAEHMAFGGYYDGIVALIDAVVESYQGKYEKISKYESFEIESYKSGDSAVTYLKALSKKVESVHSGVKDTYIQNQLDTINELINSTIYKLRFLK